MKTIYKDLDWSFSRGTLGVMNGTAHMKFRWPGIQVKGELPL